ncbi:hypothetical protein ACGFYZ_12905 [Streptomyces sp. NPDC048330]|uniref:hypothetical protein n=1 Tax=Streptomyces sp. NPDC048330 TaxID=3365533 RepID=UPI0037162280
MSSYRRRPMWRYLAHCTGLVLSPSLLFMGVPFSNRWHRRRILARKQVAQERHELSTTTTEPEQYRTDDYGTPCYRHTDPDGDQLIARLHTIADAARTEAEEQQA